ncbi:hypothetical protein [Pectobacterium parmentieri]|uniref:hypothetical protein n=1 Tax=Pectobacterium parmentieri TaxID=1905730 RepID=UPI0011AF969E|nr:hypothetical protein [Pectobacterium parmentieri]MBN3178750.1 hypothetical protein [Pectobacterium parmentieri]QPK20559.1 hypothetical protein PB20LOC_003085 [Pectobacterium parmentieri]QRN30982.1 hypothetical protein IG623_05130 [Pectobacterium parmentieri]
MLKGKVKPALFHYKIFIFSLSTTPLSATKLNVNVLDVDEHSEISPYHFSAPEDITPGTSLLSQRMNPRERQQQAVNAPPEGNSRSQPAADLPLKLVDNLALTQEVRPDHAQYKLAAEASWRQSIILPATLNHRDALRRPCKSAARNRKVWRVRYEMPILSASSGIYYQLLVFDTLSL